MRDTYEVTHERGNCIGGGVFSNLHVAVKTYNKVLKSLLRDNASGVVMLVHSGRLKGKNVLCSFEHTATPSPGVRVHGYIVRSARELNRSDPLCKPANKTFHKTEDEAVAQATHLAEKWSADHEGLVVFKAVKHVHSQPKQERTVVTKDLE